MIRTRPGALRGQFAIAGLVLGLAVGGAARAEDAPPELRFGWFDWDPYQYEEVRDRETVLTGLDIELVRAIAADAGQKLEFEQRSWADATLSGSSQGHTVPKAGFA